MFNEELSLNTDACLVDLNNKEFLSDEYVTLKTYVQNNEKRIPDLKIDGNHIYKRAFLNNTRG